MLGGVSERIHDDEPDTGEATVRALLAAQCPAWADRPVEYLRTSGTDNAMWRLGADLVVRLPRRPGAAAQIGHEIEVLAELDATALASVVATPPVRHVGEPHEVFPHPWCILGWLEGTDVWTAEPSAPDLVGLAAGLAAAVLAIGDLQGVPGPTQPPGRRGGPMEPLLRTIDWWLGDPQWNAAALVDVAGVRRLAAEAAEVTAEPADVRFTHGDLIPGNLLVAGGRLVAVIDWGGSAYGDGAVDLAPAWSVFDGASRQVFREDTGADDATWLRARTFELEHALGGVLYYVPRRHPLGSVMQRTLERILGE